MQLVFSWAPKLAKSVRVNIGCPVVRTDGRSVYGHVITKFSGMGRFSKLWGFARAWSSAITTYHPFAHLFASVNMKQLRGHESVCIDTGTRT